MERYKKIELCIRDDTDSIENLIKYIQFYTQMGHSFEVICDPDTDRAKRFFIDGDGNDKLYLLHNEEISNKRFMHFHRIMIPKLHRKEHHLDENE